MNTQRTFGTVYIIFGLSLLLLKPNLGHVVFMREIKKVC